MAKKETIQDVKVRYMELYDKYNDLKEENEKLAAELKRVRGIINRPLFG